MLHDRLVRELLGRLRSGAFIWPHFLPFSRSFSDPIAWYPHYVATRGGDFSREETPYFRLVFFSTSHPSLAQMTSTLSPQRRGMLSYGPPGGCARASQSVPALEHARLQNLNRPRGEAIEQWPAARRRAHPRAIASRSGHRSHVAYFGAQAELHAGRPPGRRQER